MARSVSFTAEEWMIIRSAPQMVSMAVAGAGTAVVTESGSGPIWGVA